MRRFPANGFRNIYFLTTPEYWKALIDGKKQNTQDWTRAAEARYLHDIPEKKTTTTTTTTMCACVCTWDVSLSA